MSSVDPDDEAFCAASIASSLVYPPALIKALGDQIARMKSLDPSIAGTDGSQLLGSMT